MSEPSHVLSAAVPSVAGDNDDRVLRERITRLLVVAIFLVFFLGFMVAPLLPRLAATFGTDLGHASALVPAYTIPYGLICLVVGPLADRFGRGRTLRWLLLPAVALPMLSATATSIGSLIAWRIATGLAVGGIAPVALALVAELYPYAERGRPVGWIFGAIAGGMAMGATAGPWLEPLIGWRGLFLTVAGANLVNAVPLSAALRKRGDVAALASPPATLSARAIAKAYVELLSTRRGLTVYSYVFLNGVFHSGVFSWLGVYFTQRYALDSTRLGLALLGYGIPGFFLGPVVGRLADRWGRRWLIRAGLVLAGLCALALAAPIPLPLLGATLVITALSFGFDLSHPLLAGIVSGLDPVRTAQAMALNTFAIFIGLGVGSIVFGSLYFYQGMVTALVAFALLQLTIAAATSFLFDRTWR